MSQSENIQILLDRFRSKNKPFCLITTGDDRLRTDAYFGNLLRLEKIDDLLAILPNDEKNHLPEKEHLVVGMVPFSQIKEHKFQCRSANESILTLKIENHLILKTTDVIELIQTKFDSTIEIESEPSFHPSAIEYEQLVADIYEKEIRGGEGSSFVTPRLCSTRIKNFDNSKPLTLFNRLLLSEKGAYWTFLFYDGDERWFVGASPEKHLLVDDEKVLMHPISGTYRKSIIDPIEDGKELCNEFKKGLMNFLTDDKEINELFMVTDEELKMMCRICPDGGDMNGPTLREMSHLVHTEYSLIGKWTNSCCASIDFENDLNAFKKEMKRMLHAFRISMYAPTVTGSPVKNACRRLYEYESTSRGYYSSAAILLGRNTNGRPFFDSCITIRTMEIMADGRLEMRVGATLVRDSKPAEEAKETVWKLKGLLSVLQRNSAPIDYSMLSVEMKSLISKCFQTPEEIDSLKATLLHRNNRLSTFWTTQQTFSGNLTTSIQAKEFLFLNRKRFLLINNDDDFIHMLSHMFVSLGFKTKVQSYEDFILLLKKMKKEDLFASLCQSYDLIVIGPGPGDPRNCDEKMNFNSTLIKFVLTMVDGPRPKMMCLCLGHQLLGNALSLDLMKKKIPFQGIQIEETFMSTVEHLGFYNSFYLRTQSDTMTALAVEGWEVDISRNKEEILMIRNSSQGILSCQYHPESIFTTNGIKILEIFLRFLFEKTSGQELLIRKPN